MGMTKDEYMAYHQSMCDRMVETTRVKNADYTGTNPDPFANFGVVDILGITSGEIGFMVRMTDKFMRIRSFVQKGILLVKDESIEDTLIDLANYCILFAGYIRSKKINNIDN
jgi:hypothetical protein